MIKKLLLLVFMFLINLTFCQQQEMIKRGHYELPTKQIENSGESNLAEPVGVENTGFYFVIVKHMPSYWTFWNRWKPVSIMAKYAETTTQEVLRNIELEMPILMTFNLQAAQNLMAELLPLDCVIEIHEVTFSFGSEEDA